MHNKFILLKKNGVSNNNDAEEAVWTGSCNFTDGGIYGQSNVAHSKLQHVYFHIIIRSKSY